MSIRWLPKDLSTAQALYWAGASRNAIASAVNRTPIAIKRMITSYGWERSSKPIVDVSIFDTDSEFWRQVEGLPYAVSSAGRVLSLMPNNVGRILKFWTDDEGYRHVTLQIETKSVRFAIHKLCAIAFVGERPSSLHEVAHNDGDPSNNKYTNLRWSTKKANFADRLKHQTAPRQLDGKFLPSENSGRARYSALPVRQAEAAGLKVWRPAV